MRAQRYDCAERAAIALAWRAKVELAAGKPEAERTRGRADAAERHMWAARLRSLIAILVLLTPATALAADDAAMVGVGSASGVGGLLVALAGRWAWGRLFGAPTPPPRPPAPSLVDGVHLPRLFAPLVAERCELALTKGPDEQRAALSALAREARAETCAGCEREREALRASEAKREALAERVTIGLHQAVTAVERLCDAAESDDGKAAQ